MLVINKEKLKEEICRLIDEHWTGRKKVSININYSINELPEVTIEETKYILNCVNYED